MTTAVTDAVTVTVTVTITSPLPALAPEANIGPWPGYRDMPLARGIDITVTDSLAALGQGVPTALAPATPNGPADTTYVIVANMAEHAVSPRAQVQVGYDDDEVGVTITTSSATRLPTCRPASRRPASLDDQTSP